MFCINYLLYYNLVIIQKIIHVLYKLFINCVVSLVSMFDQLSANEIESIIFV